MPSRPRRRIGWFVWSLGCLLPVYNWLLAIWTTPQSLIPIFTHLIVGMPLFLTAARLGISQVEIGLQSRHVPQGFLWGGLPSLTVWIIFALALMVSPEAVQRLGGEGIANYERRDLLLHLIRIATGTAVFEEVMFRGVILGGLSLTSSKTLRSVLLSSLFFVLWHVGPTMVIGVGGAKTPVSQATGLIGPLLAGLAFPYLRFWSKSLLAPYLLHGSLNSGAVLATYFATH